MGHTDWPYFLLGRLFPRLQKTLESKPDAKLQKKEMRELKVLSRQSTNNKTAGSLFNRLKGVIGQKEKDLGMGRSRDRDVQISFR